MVRFHPEYSMPLQEPYPKESNSKWNWHREALIGWLEEMRAIIMRWKYRKNPDLFCIQKRRPRIDVNILHQVF